MRRKTKRKTTLIILLSVCILQAELGTLHADSEDCKVPSVLGFETGLTIPEVQKQIKEHHPYAEMDLKSPTNLAMGSGLGTTTEFFFDETQKLRADFEFTAKLVRLLIRSVKCAKKRLNIEPRLRHL